MMSFKIFVFSVIVCSVCVVTEYKSVTDFASSVAHLRYLLDTHKAVIKNIEEYILKEPQIKNNLNQYIENFKREQEIAENDVEDYLTNPINGFTLIKRLTKELEYIEKYIKEANTDYKRSSEVGYPSELDFYTAKQAIARLQNTYNLNVTDLAMGILRGNFSQYNAPFIEKFTPMTATDCYEIGTYWKEKKKFKKAIKWLARALYKNSSEGIKDAYPITREDLVRDIGDAYNELDDLDNTLRWTRMLHSLSPNPEIKEKINTLKKMILEGTPKTKSKKGKSFKLNETELSIEGQESFLNSLCRGEVDIARNVSKSLTCKYLRDSHPFLTIAPVKMEQLYPDPEIVMFHGVMMDHEIEELKRIAAPKLNRQSSKYPSALRTSKTVWLSNTCTLGMRKVVQRVAQITGMKLDSSLPAQIANYGIAGGYDSHVDYYLFQNKEKYEMVGNRFATFMIYMSNVMQGGATVFIELGLSVFPVKGSALFWQNLVPTGDPDYDTIHSGCPVLKGDKWILNKWINQIGQELQFPCSAQYKEDEDIRIIARPVLKDPSNSVS